MSGKHEGETLAGASERRLQAVISRRGRRSYNATAELDACFKAAQEATGLPKAARAQGPAGTCGAPAKADWDEKAEEDNLPDLDDYDEEDWEAEGSDNDGHMPVPPRDLELDIDAIPGVAASGDQDEGKRPLTREEKVQKMWEDYYRKQANHRRAELQQVLHRSSALCTLAHALLLDQAANDPVLQAICYSLLDSTVQPRVHGGRGCSPADLEPAVYWVSKAFSVSISEDTIKQAEEAPPDGIEGAASRLQAVAAGRAGMPEELVALFVATMRAYGLLARSVRALDVLPLRPGRAEGRRRLAVLDPRRHKPDSAKGAAPRGPVQPIGPANSQRAPAKRRKGVPEEASPPAKEAATDGKSMKRKRRTKAEQAKEAEAQASAAQAQAAAESGDDSKENIAERMQASAKAQAARGAEPGTSEHKRRGDLEFENQLAMALQASAAAPVSKQPLAGEVKQVDITGGVAMRVKGKAPAESQANGDTSAHDSTPQSKRQKAQSPGKKPAGAMWTRGARKPSGGRCWAEVYCGSAKSGSWVHVDPLSGVVDRAYEIEKGFVRETPLTYVVALSGNTAKDVTQRYVKSMRPLQRLRDEEWWGETMASLRPTLQQSAQPQRFPASTNSLKGAKQLGKERAESGALAHMLSAREDAEFHQKASAEIQDVPNTIPAFKSHPKYVLERHITRYDLLKPSAQKIGLHRGEAFYLRADLAHLHTAEMWERQGRAVKQAELSQPAKEVRKRGAKDEEPVVDSRAAEEEAEMFGEPDRDDPFGSKEKEKGAPEVTKLYGDWQTEEWIPPKAENGIVPKNDRGNVLCPPLAYCLPQGTVHLKGLPRITLTCKALELDYAVAMVGFETRGGMSVPCFDGVVVCEEHAQLITDAHHAAERERQEKAASKAHAAAESHWRNLLRSIFTRLHVQGQYADAAATPEIGQVPSPAKEAEVVGATSEHEEEEKKPAAKSGAAAAAAIEAAKEDAVALKQRRATLKDPVVASREAALQASVAAPMAARIPSLHPSVATIHGSSGPRVKSMESEAAAPPASIGREPPAGRGGLQRKGRKGAKHADDPTDRGARDASEQKGPQRKRTRSGLVVDLEEI